MRPSLLPLVLLSLLLGACASVPRGGVTADSSAGGSAGQAVSIETRVMTLDQFMPDRLSVSAKVPIVVPAAYELATLKGASPFSAFWLHPADVPVANRQQELPGTNGYMVGAIAMNVGYDKRRDVFIGADDPETLRRLSGGMGFATVTIERFSRDAHPVLMMTATTADSGQRAYLMYIGLDHDTNVVLVSWRPPGNSQKIGDYLWDQMKAGLVRSTTHPTRRFPATSR